jgi:hypothetical protein
MHRFGGVMRNKFQKITIILNKLTAFSMLAPKLFLVIFLWGIFNGLVIADGGGGDPSHGFSVSDGKQSVFDVTPRVEYPYHPQELWRRFFKLVEMPPDLVDYVRFGEILGVKFEKENLYFFDLENPQDSRNNFSASTDKLNPSIPFYIHFKSRHFAADNSGFLYFYLNVFNEKEYLGKKRASFLTELSSNYCVTLDESSLGALGFHYSKNISLREAMKLFMHGNSDSALPARYYIIDENGLLKNYIRVEHLQNGCVTQIEYLKSF